MTEAPAVIAKLHQAQALLQQGKHADALSLAQRVLAPPAGDRLPAPLRAAALGIQAWSAFQLGRSQQAEHSCRLAHQLDPANPNLATNLCVILLASDQRRPDQRTEAKQLLERVLAQHPAQATARVALANTLLEDGQPARALAVCEGQPPGSLPDGELTLTHTRALSAFPSRREQAIALARAAIERSPQDPRPRLALIHMLQGWPGVTPAQHAGAHQAYGVLLQRSVAPMPPAHGAMAASPRDDDRRLTVALLSPDLRRHSVAYFVRAVLAHTDRAACTLRVYHTNAIEDDVSTALRALADAWTNVAQESDQAIAQRLRQDGVDILIDLAGHTTGARPGLLALRPVPVQATYCGYPDTLGLSRVDWRIVDQHTDPPGPVSDGPSFDQRCAERLLRLDPCFLCYTPSPDAPEPQHHNPHSPPAPDGTARPITFASFNACRKLNPLVAGLWARVLDGAPGSRLLLKASEFTDSSVMADVRDLFARAGVADDRLSLLAPTASTREHLALYQQVDVALDTFPYHGTTTTCEALWMGVPVVTLAGDVHASRVGVSLLHAVGLPELVANTPEEFVGIARELSGDAARLAALRAGLRDRMRASVLCDGPAFGKRWTGALRTMWRERRAAVAQS